ncbi:MAG: hypothetical protein KDC53_15430 [Saprospiraceae bacterium]|nr:hypothetical protein [Saprospiraceae bacterium]
MINLKFGSFAFTLATISLIWACKKNEPTVDQAQLGGRWELNWAQINGAETDRLRDLYFVFLPDTSMQTNILGSERNFKFDFDGESIKQHSDPAMEFLIKEVNDSTLTVETEIKGSIFTIYLDRSQPKPNSPM